MTNFQELVVQFAKSGALKGMEPWLPQNNNEWLLEWQDFNVEYRKLKVGQCLGEMPDVYHAYGRKLQCNMDRLRRQVQEEYDRERLAGIDESFAATKAADWVSIMVDAVLNWAGQSIQGPRVVRAELERFAVVVWDFYEKFVTAYNKVVEEVPKNGRQRKTDPPPLVAFSATRVLGPHTITADQMYTLIGTRVAVVGLPSVFASFPLLWAPLAHEVFGHDVQHSLGRTPPALLMPEIIKELRDIVEANVSEKWRPTWNVWTEEMAADLAGLLCMGPYFAIGFAALMSVTACSDLCGPPWTPGIVGTTLVARGGRAYDEHPPDLLRLYAMLGAAEAMLEMQGFDKLSYSVEALKSVVKEARTPSVIIDVYDFDSQSVLMRYNGDTLIRDAQKAGRAIITEPLKSLGNRQITYFHSWNNSDEDKASEIAKIAVSGKLSQPNAFKAQHLLAGAIMAAYSNPDACSDINKFLNKALSGRANDAFSDINKFLNAFTA
jgi:hypothetical protein